jgi:hypothetical protein
MYVNVHTCICMHIYIYMYIYVYTQTCYVSSCEWSVLTCAHERSNIRTCPLFDATAYRSYVHLQQAPGYVVNSLTSSQNSHETYLEAFDMSTPAYGVRGGTSRSYGRCRTQFGENQDVWDNRGQMCENRSVYATYTGLQEVPSPSVSSALEPGGAVPSEFFATFDRYATARACCFA